MPRKTAKKSRGGAREGAGRPPLAEPVTIVSGRLPESDVKRLDKFAAANSLSRSAAVVELLRRGLG